jgi:predicted RNA binding protein YcfA (HicA-like mRNA interferase family)
MKLPLLTARELGRILKKMGFEMIRQHGSHVFYMHPDGRTTVVPDHSGEDLDTGLLNKIIKHDLMMTREEFLRHI